ncbi:cytosolic carboxypeptidase 2 isoform X2 [Neolamprologus brichardi]|uniref:cytosolic carboxypeptidase 2 isoform X2 n=1 Tax=Neolamprologus brichardi TaxID=32507 RepID=UPI0003EC4EBC|nr:cytosolic carboxypeptidase 2 isoform X2 [Neolamprologus brichardi]
MYGCKNKADSTLKLHARVFPLMMSKNASNKFSFNSCKFRVQKSKEGTGRIVMWRLGIINSYTMEATFGGSSLGDRRGTHFTTQDLKSLGFHLCDTLLDYCDPDPIKNWHCCKRSSEKDWAKIWATALISKPAQVAQIVQIQKDSHFIC